MKLSRNTKRRILILYLAFCMVLGAGSHVGRLIVRHGGVATIFLRYEIVGQSKRINEAHFVRADEAVSTKDGCVYIRATGRLSFDSTNNVTYVVELPVEERKREYREFEAEHGYVYGMQIQRLPSGNLHRGQRYWDKISKKSISHISIQTVHDRSEIERVDQQVYFQAEPSQFTYTEEEAIYGKDIYWMRFNPSPRVITKPGPLIFIPITYAFDLITIPFQVVYYEYVKANT
jgi:hypothetical protein